MKKKDIGQMTSYEEGAHYLEVAIEDLKKLIEGMELQWLDKFRIEEAFQNIDEAFSECILHYKNEIDSLEEHFINTQSNDEG